MTAALTRCSRGAQLAGLLRRQLGHVQHVPGRLDHQGAQAERSDAVLNHP
ncbi:hypothetical protein LV779_08195 [Streptomyces thinghirensis]|nr:hypothetical protein [Streptomyces thinghirensis]